MGFIMWLIQTGVAAAAAVFLWRIAKVLESRHGDRRDSVVPARDNARAERPVWPLPSHVGLVLLDAVSVEAEPNIAVADAVRMMKATWGLSIVEAAHLGGAEPSVVQAFTRSVDQGATQIVVHPLVSAGEDCSDAIARALEDAPDRVRDVAYVVSKPLGIDPRVAEVVMQRSREALDM